MKRRLLIKREACMGCGSCAIICPAVFWLENESGKARCAPASEGYEDLIEDAVESCPQECILFSNSVSGQS